MVLDEVSLKQPASPEQPAQVNPIDKQPEENGARAESVPQHADAKSATTHQPVESGASAEAAPQSEGAKPETKRKSSVVIRFFSHSFWAHPFVLVIVGSIAGAVITHRYTLQQKDIDHERSIQLLNLTSRRSFLDEMNKIRIQKIGEVWEQIDKNEVALDDLLSAANKSPESMESNFDKIQSLVNEDIVTINKNRFWLGETYSVFQNYLAINEEIVSGMILGQEGIDLTEPLKRREEAKQDINRVRSEFLKGDPELSK